MENRLRRAGQFLLQCLYKALALIEITHDSLLRKGDRG